MYALHTLSYSVLDNLPQSCMVASLRCVSSVRLFGKSKSLIGFQSWRYAPLLNLDKKLIVGGFLLQITTNSTWSTFVVRIYPITSTWEWIKMLPWEAWSSDPVIRCDAPLTVAGAVQEASVHTWIQPGLLHAQARGVEPIMHGLNNHHDKLFSGSPTIRLAFCYEGWWVSLSSRTSRTKRLFAVLPQ